MKRDARCGNPVFRVFVVPKVLTLAIVGVALLRTQAEDEEDSEDSDWRGVCPSNAMIVNPEP